MSRLKNINFSVTSAINEKVEFESEVIVSDAGRFTVTVPEDVWDHAKAFLQAGDNFSKWMVSFEVLRLRRKVAGFGVIGNTLREVRDFINAVLGDFLKVETIEEDVIAYRYVSGLSYWVNPDGSIAPNGSIGDSDGRWNSNDTRREDSEGISFAARVYRKLTHKRGDKVTVNYEYWRHENLQDTKDLRSRLNFFCQSNIDFHDGDERWRIIPYTPQAAEFFYRIALSLCQIDQKLAAFFAKHENVEQAIAAGTTPLLGG